MHPIKTLFILRDYAHGGIPRVLVNLLDCIDMNRVQASVLVCNPFGMFCGRISNCNILPCPWLIRLLICNYRREKGHKLLAVVLKLIRHCIKACVGRDLLLDWAIQREAASLADCYDVVWACSEDVPARIAQSINDTSTKIVWIHNNYSSQAFDVVSSNGLPDFLSFDKIVCVSKHAKKALVDTLIDKLKIDVGKRTEILYNIVNEEEIIQYSKKEPDDTRFVCDRFVIVSIGRLAWEKNTVVIPAIAADLKRRGISFTWYLIGGGSEKMQSIVKAEIQRQNVEDVVVLLGEKSNPYSYLAYANLLALPSRFETYPTVVNEAKVLGVPVISTDYSGVEEILSPEDGWICKLHEFPERIALAIEGGITSEMKSHKCFDVHNKAVLERFNEIIIPKYTKNSLSE